jgi:hypothetical protein
MPAPCADLCRGQHMQISAGKSTRIGHAGSLKRGFRLKDFMKIIPIQ